MTQRFWLGVLAGAGLGLWLNRRAQPRIGAGGGRDHSGYSRLGRVSR